ncbi:MAG: YbhB/YbcL family Raf kinase inhibitor-like protein [Rudaea sp.]
MFNQAFLMLIVLALGGLLAACASSDAPNTPKAASGTATGGLTVTSTAFSEGGNIPRQYSCQGDRMSPELAWSGAPAATQSYALVVEDPDAPSGTFIHWVAYDIPASQTQISEGAGQAGKSGRNGARQPGYTPPCPPSGTHHYLFHVYALDIPTLNLPEGATRDQVTGEMQGHVLAQGTLTGKYQKQ